MKIQIPKKIRAEDFKSDQQEIVNKIGDIFNCFADEVYQVLDKRIDNDNLARQRVIVNVSMGPTGVLISQPQVRTTLYGKVAGVVVLSAINQTNPSVYPAGAPFISFTINGNILTILSITGLQANNEYKLALDLIV